MFTKDPPHSGPFVALSSFYFSLLKKAWFLNEKYQSCSKMRENGVGGGVKKEVLTSMRHDMC